MKKAPHLKYKELFKIFRHVYVTCRLRASFRPGRAALLLFLSHCDETQQAAAQENKARGFRDDFRVLRS